MPAPPRLRLVGDAVRTPTPTPSRSEGKRIARSEEQALHGLRDDRLVPLAAQGDRVAVEILYRRHASFALNLAIRIAGSTNDAEDVVHDAFIKALENLANLRNPGAFKTWLGSIVVHAMRSRLRRARFMRFVGLGRSGDPIDIDCLISGEASPRSRAEIAQVYALLRTLPPDDRIAWTLRHVQGHDLQAAADLAGCSLATVKRRIRRVQRYLEDHYVEPAEPPSTGEEAMTVPPAVLKDEAAS